MLVFSANPYKSGRPEHPPNHEVPLEQGWPLISFQYLIYLHITAMNERDSCLHALTMISNVPMQLPPSSKQWGLLYPWASSNLGRPFLCLHTWGKGGSVQGHQPWTFMMRLSSKCSANLPLQGDEQPLGTWTNWPGPANHENRLRATVAKQFLTFWKDALHHYSDTLLASPHSGNKSQADAYNVKDCELKVWAWPERMYHWRPCISYSGQGKDIISDKKGILPGIYFFGFNKYS